ncbi:hypothetical protein L484_015273 [Morus notabilis]|uniref:Uncharacterized protein n=1 Tax=Morus notabilis TaxID=981085 RepID=W9RI87_9ROSA|nr:hypothetical protein L484_015273 [Morus notabilis]
MESRGRPEQRERVAERESFGHRESSLKGKIRKGRERVFEAGYSRGNQCVVTGNSRVAAGIFLAGILEWLLGFSRGVHGNKQRVFGLEFQSQRWRRNSNQNCGWSLGISDGIGGRRFWVAGDEAGGLIASDRTLLEVCRFGRRRTKNGLGKFCDVAMAVKGRLAIAQQQGPSSSQTPPCSGKTARQRQR